MEGGLDIYQILLESGFVVKFVLLVLIFCSVFSWAIIFQKRKLLNTIESLNLQFLDFFKGSSNLVEIQRQANECVGSSVGTMFTCGFDELVKIKTKLNDSTCSEEKENRGVATYFSENGLQALERALKKGSNQASEVLESRLYSLASIGSISPFIGLFGTVWGIIDSFAGLASGGGSIEAVAPGIAEALVATAVGLAAAIPAVWAFNIFNAKINKLQGEMDSFGQDFLNLIERNVFIKKDL